PAEIDSQTTSVRSGQGHPESRRDLITEPAAYGVALVLRNGEAAGHRANRIGCIVPQEQSSGNRKIPDGQHVRIANEAGKRTPARDFQLYFLPVNLGAPECDREADSRIQQQIVVREIV